MLEGAWLRRGEHRQRLRGLAGRVKGSAEQPRETTRTTPKATRRSLAVVDVDAARGLGIQHCPGFNPHLELRRRADAIM